MLIFMVLLEMLLQNSISQLYLFLFTFDIFIQKYFSPVILIYFFANIHNVRCHYQSRSIFMLMYFLDERFVYFFSFYEKKSIDQVVNNLRKDRNQATFISFIHLVQIHLQAAT